MHGWTLALIAALVALGGAVRTTIWLLNRRIADLVT
jgi:hypothetical protein